MRRRRRTSRSWSTLLVVAAMLLGVASHARAQAATPDDTAQAPPPAEAKPSMEIYGFAMLDMGYQAKQNDPNWFDVLRPVKLPSFPDEFGKDGRWFSGVRQSRLGVRSSLPTELGDLKTVFEFELFGTGVDAGQTTFRLRHAYGEVGQFGAGQTWSPFMDPDVFPNSIEYWGPNGMVFFRNVQVRWMPLGNSDIVLALERPGAAADQGVLADRIEVQNVKARFPLPDFSGAYKLSRGWGYVRGAFLLGEMKWDDLLADQFDLSGSATRWGINISSNLKLGTGTVRLQYVFGEGVENYMNDAPVDVGIKANPGNAVTPIVGTALPVQGIVAFYDHTWNELFTSSVGYSRIDIDNSNGQAANAFKDGQYALFNLLYTPVKNVMVGGELQWGKRENFRDGFTSDDFRVQFSFKYNFSYKVGG
jgi:DcaP outer membrane protein